MQHLKWECPMMGLVRRPLFCAAQLSTISVFYKQRNNFFFPVTSYALPTVLLRVPLSVATGIIFTALTYFVVGFAPDAGRCALSHQKGL